MSPVVVNTPVPIMLATTIAAVIAKPSWRRGGVMATFRS